jgi:DNA-binding NarL/FixJ family response regulator
LLGAIRILVAGESYLCPKITEIVIREYTQLAAESSLAATSILSKREHEVLQLIADGKNTKEIAFTLGVSGKTVDAQRSNIMKKLDLYSIAELTKFAVRKGLTTLEPQNDGNPH